MNTIEVDARGLRCPLPVVRLAEAARYAASDTRITVLATDPAARHDIPAWCRMRDHDLVEMTEIADEPDPAAGADADDVALGTGGADADDVALATAGSDRGHVRVPPAASDPAYLRFVVLVRPQPPSAAGAGSLRARSSRVT